MANRVQQATKDFQCKTLVGVNCSQACGVDIGRPGSNDEAVLYGGFPVCGSAPGVYRMPHAYCAAKHYPRNNTAARTRFVFSDQLQIVGTWPATSFYPDNTQDPLQFREVTENEQCAQIHTKVQNTSLGLDVTTNCIPFAIQCETYIENCGLFIDPNLYGAIFIHNKTTEDRSTALSSITYFDNQMQGELCRFVPHAPNAATVRYEMPRSVLNGTVNATYSISTASCRYVECLKDMMCNSAMEDPPGMDTLVAVDCNVTEWAVRVREDPIQLASLSPQLNFNNATDIVGVLEARPSVNGPAVDLDRTVEWVAFSSQSRVLALTQYRFSDEFALAFCNEVAKSEGRRPFTAADAIINFGTSNPTPSVLITDFRCLNVDSIAKPMTDCYYTYHQYYFFALPQAAATGVRCGYEQLTCPRFTAFEIVGAFCGDPTSRYKGQTLWISANENGTYITRLATGRQPYNQSIDHTAQNTYRVNLEGYNCRLGHGDEGQEAWSKLLNDTNTGVLTAALDYRLNPLTGAQDTVIRIVDTIERSPLYFTTCNSCPSTAPVGTYCNEGRVDLDYFEFTTANDTDVYIYRPMANAKGLRSAGCQATFTLKPDLPGEPCRISTVGNGCSVLGNSTLEFDLESGTFLRFDALTTATTPYRLCRIDPPVVCSSTISGAYCGSSQYFPDRTVRMTFSDDNEVLILYQNKGQNPVICDDTPYAIRASEVGCIVDIPALFNYSGCLNATGLLGRAQGKQPVIFDPEKDRVLMNLLDDTYYMNKCRSCDLAEGDTYCSVDGKSLLTVTSNTSYNLLPVKDTQYSWTDAHLLASRQPCLFYLKDKTGAYWRAVRFGEANITLHPVTDKGDTRDVSESITDTMKRCSQREAAPKKYCSGNSNFDLQVEILDPLHMSVKNVQRSSSLQGSSVEISYVLLPQLVFYTPPDQQQKLINTIHPLFDRLKFMVYLNADEGLLALLDEFGYVRFKPCARVSLTMIVGIPSLAGVTFLTLVFLIYSRIKFFRQLQREMESGSNSVESVGGSKLDRACEEVEMNLESYGRDSADTQLAIFKLAHIAITGTDNDKAEQIIEQVIAVASSKLHVAHFKESDDGSIQMLSADDIAERQRDVVVLATKKGPISALRRAAAVVDGRAQMLLADHVTYVSQKMKDSEHMTGSSFGGRTSRSSFVGGNGAFQA